MADDPAMELRVSRLENDTTSIYELLGDIRSTQQEHSTRLDTIDGRLDAIDLRLDSMDRRFDAMDLRFDAMDRRFDAMDRRFDTIGLTLTEIVRRLPDPS